MKALRIKRVYDAPEKSDGARVLVDRLWPRGMAKDKARLDLWLKDISPSNELRRKFHAKPEDWDKFRAAYAKELKSAEAKAAIAELNALRRKGAVTLLYAAHDEEHNNAVALKLWLDA
jgi:uncharacterized protein YeaO (DUF488 family)